MLWNAFQRLRYKITDLKMCLLRGAQRIEHLPIARDKLRFWQVSLAIVAHKTMNAWSNFAAAARLPKEKYLHFVGWKLWHTNLKCAQHQVDWENWDCCYQCHWVCLFLFGWKGPKNCAQLRSMFNDLWSKSIVCVYVLHTVSQVIIFDIDCAIAFYDFLLVTPSSRTWNDCLDLIWFEVYFMRV